MLLFAVQYLGALNNYSTAISYLCKEPKYRVRAMEIARSEGLLTDRRKKRSMSKVSLSAVGSMIHGLDSMCEVVARSCARHQQADDECCLAA